MYQNVNFSIFLSGYYHKNGNYCFYTYTTLTTFTLTNLGNLAMDKISKVGPLPQTVRQKWDYVKELDEKINAGSAATGALADRLKNGVKYRLQSQAIEHGTEAILKNRWDTQIIGDSLKDYKKLTDFAKTVSEHANSTTYTTLAEHLKDGKALKDFDWKALAKGRAWNQIDHTTCIADGTARSVGRALATNVAKGFIIHNAYKCAKTSFENSQADGDGKFKSYCEAGKTAAKELGKSMASWEAGSFGTALTSVMLPKLGAFGAVAGGILAGGTVGYLAEKMIPKPVKQTVAIRTQANNPFNC